MGEDRCRMAKRLFKHVTSRYPHEEPNLWRYFWEAAKEIHTHGVEQGRGEADAVLDKLRCSALRAAGQYQRRENWAARDEAQVAVDALRDAMEQLRPAEEEKP